MADREGHRSRLGAGPGVTVATGGPDLIIVGQVTVDDIVPAHPGPWRREIGGSALYALAGARHWLDPARIGLVTRVGRDYPFDLAPILDRSGVLHRALRRIADDHLIEWLIYEEDGGRRSLPRNPGLRDVGAEGSSTMAPYFDLFLAISPSAEDIPSEWLPASAVHLCPQIGSRHHDSLAFLAGKVGFVSVDPSPRYSRDLDPAALARFLAGATAFMPSEQEIRPLLGQMPPEAAVDALHRAGFPEVVLKRGGAPILVRTADCAGWAPTLKVEIVDPTGAGDSFCGAYAACRTLGFAPFEAARRAAASAALIVGSSGAEQALSLGPPEI